MCTHTYTHIDEHIFVFIIRQLNRFLFRLRGNIFEQCFLYVGAYVCTAVIYNWVPNKYVDCQRSWKLLQMVALMTSLLPGPLRSGQQSYMTKTLGTRVMQRFAARSSFQLLITIQRTFSELTVEYKLKLFDAFFGFRVRMSGSYIANTTIHLSVSNEILHLNVTKGVHMFTSVFIIHR